MTTRHDELGPMAMRSGVNCGGPLICHVCAMNYAAAYKSVNRTLWAEKYQEHARNLTAPRRALYGMLVPDDTWLPPAYDITFDDTWRLFAGQW